jgi:hypothetical protein
VLKICLQSLACLLFLWGCTDTSILVTGQEEILEDQEGENLILAMQNIELRQGEGGGELWHLKAYGASMEKERGKILVEKPKVTYFFPPPDTDTVFISSVYGDVDQTNHILRFLRNVRVNQKNAEIRGELLIYNGTTRTMTLPQGGSFTDAGMRGSASLLRWRMTEKLIEAAGNVKVDFTAGHPENRSSAPAGLAGSTPDEAR